jgi:PKD repeat protein
MGPVAWHTYTIPGFYTVTLTAVNNCGQAIAAASLTILAPPRSWAVYLPIVLRNNIP